MPTLFSNMKLENEDKLSSQQYTPEFKRRTLGLLAESGKSAPQLAKELGISENTLYGWRHTAKSDTGFTRPRALSKR